jgi:hypothetical protein
VTSDTNSRISGLQQIENGLTEGDGDSPIAFPRQLHAVPAQGFITQINNAAN